MVQLLSGCPALETMELSSCRSISHLEINTNFNLKRVKLETCYGAYERDCHSLEIIAPYVQHLEISGTIGDIKYYRLLDVSSSVSAELTFGIRYPCRKLSSEIESCNRANNGILVFRDTRKRKSLIVELSAWYELLSFLSYCMSFGICLEERRHKLFELSQFLLKNALALEKFLIIAKRRKCRHCSKKCVSPYLSQMAAKLEGCWRSSTKFMMVFHDSNFDD
ncbi:hypothetical protein BC332_00957 [Capsicum chinense]|nr:hypothetical protein BC332_00957 [Capsicum chinense]